MPQGEHSTLQRDLIRALDDQLSPTKIARAYPELRCTYPTGSHPVDVYGGRSIVPDISVYQWERIPRQPNGRIANRFEVCPDWSVEILSPDQNHTKVTRNILHCLEYGTAMGWLIDADESCVFDYQPNQTPKFFDQPQASLPTPSFATGVELTVEQLFSLSHRKVHATLLCPIQGISNKINLKAG